MRYPETIARIVSLFQKLPGVGKKTAEKFAFHLLDWEEKEIQHFAAMLSKSSLSLRKCSNCHSITDLTVCSFCSLNETKSKKLCIVSHPKNVYAIEATHLFDGVYHVLSSLLSPIQGKSIDTKEIDHLRSRIQKEALEEVIFALDSTLEGDATALYLQDQLKSLPISMSKLATGLPMGSTLEYVDEETLHLALRGRIPFCP